MGKRGSVRKKKRIRFNLKAHQEVSVQKRKWVVDSVSENISCFDQKLLLSSNYKKSNHANPISMLNDRIRSINIKDDTTNEPSTSGTNTTRVKNKREDKLKTKCVRNYPYEYVFQFKITLQRIKPAIWRRIQVPEDYAFWDLHVAIQDAMGWDDCHLHRFFIKDPRTGLTHTITYGFDDDNEDNNNNNSNNNNKYNIDEIKLHVMEAQLTDYFTLKNTICLYEYDFNEPWEHKIVLEQIIPLNPNIDYPICIGGKRACPIENCGGVWGYKEIVKSIENPGCCLNFQEHVQFVMATNIDYDPEKFDPSKVKFDGPLERWISRFIGSDGDVDESLIDDSDLENCNETFDQLSVRDVVKSADKDCANTIYQFRISLRGSKPKIYRQVQVPGDYTFWDLHNAIQNAFGWEDLYFHLFEVTDPISNKSHIINLDEDVNMWDIKKTKAPEEYARICDYFTTFNKTACYGYDFRSYWEHKVLLEKILPAVPGNKYPQCVGGARGCPPEGCGGIWRYEEYLNLSKNPDSADFKKNATDINKVIDRTKPDDFDPAAITFTDPRICWKERFASEGDTEDEYCIDKRLDNENKNELSPSGILQFKITLTGSKPRIWRRIQVPANYTFWQLAIAIQNAMGWDMFFWHRFSMMSPITHSEDTIVISFTNQELYFPRAICTTLIPEQSTSLLQYFTRLNRVAWFEYECEAFWRHKVALEKCLPMTTPPLSSPICLGGKRASPIVTSGGINDYEDLVFTQNELKCYGSFDPDEFDYKLVEFHDPETVLEEFLKNLGSNCKFPKLPLQIKCILQFKISLLGIKPEIWRTVQIPDYYTFWDFHVAIQNAMGWDDNNLHQFEVSCQKETFVITLNDFDNIDPTLQFVRQQCWERRLPEADTKVLKLFHTEGKSGRYEYDFGERWEHEIFLEMIIPVDGEEEEDRIESPKCIAGEGACPIQGCGGVRGYVQLLEILNNPSRSSYPIIKEWVANIKGKFDPDKFNPKSVRFCDPVARWKHRHCTTKIEQK